MRFEGQLWAVLLFGAVGIAGCSDPTTLAAAERGRRIYFANCITCHHPDPSRAGPGGPEIADASRTLVEAKVIHGTYPPGYTPKRTTKVMVTLPHLAARIDDLVAFLAHR